MQVPEMQQVPRKLEQSTSQKVFGAAQNGNIEPQVWAEFTLSAGRLSALRDLQPNTTVTRNSSARPAAPLPDN